MIIDFADTDLQELIEYGKNNKYKKHNITAKTKV